MDVHQVPRQLYTVLKGSPALFKRVTQAYKKESFFVYADNTDSMNDGME